MARFKYIAYSKDQKQLVGYMDAVSLEEARAELHKLGLSVINIDVTTEEQAGPGTGKKTFEFEAADKTAKRLIGTIDAENIFQAYLRLIGEYKFKIYWIVDASLPDVEKEQQKSQLLVDLQTQYQHYVEEEERRKTPWLKRIFGTTNLKDIQKNIQIIQSQTEAVIKKAQEALEILGNDISPDARVQLKQKIEELLILKTSTNTERLQILSNDLLRLIKEQQNLLQKQGGTDKKASVDKLNAIFQDIYSFSRFRDLKVDFGSLGKILARMQSTLETFKVNRQEQKSEELLKKESLISALREKIRNGYGTLRAQFQVYFKLFASGKSKLLQEETWQGIRGAWKDVQHNKAQVKFLEKEVLTIKKQRHKVRIERLDVLGLHFMKLSTLLYECKLFAHWLLLFYVSYFLFCTFVIRFSIDPFQEFARSSVLTSPFLTYLILFLVFLYSAISLHLSYFQKKPLLGGVLGLGFTVLYVFILANF